MLQDQLAGFTSYRVISGSSIRLRPYQSSLGVVHSVSVKDLSPSPKVGMQGTFVTSYLPLFALSFFYIPIHPLMSAISQVEIDDSNE